MIGVARGRPARPPRPGGGSDKRGSVDFPIWRSERHTARADTGAYPESRRRRAAGYFAAFFLRAAQEAFTSARTPPPSLWPSSDGASSPVWRRTRSPRQGWPQPPAAARRSAEPLASPERRSRGACAGFRARRARPLNWSGVTWSPWSAAMAAAVSLASRSFQDVVGSPPRPAVPRRRGRTPRSRRSPPGHGRPRRGTEHESPGSNEAPA